MGQGTTTKSGHTHKRLAKVAFTLIKIHLKKTTLIPLKAGTPHSYIYFFDEATLSVLNLDTPWPEMVWDGTNTAGNGTC
jgi:hypothetical protein